MVPFRRPAGTLEGEELKPLFRQYSESEINPALQASIRETFRAAITRLPHVLQESDTALFWVLPGPRIVRY
jgi:hypothetical protein